ncbi:MAG: hypothetical protein MRJ92_12805 [Nitrospira sp.]|nr:hypothetical protein [Nitrospira sp.]
MGIWRGMAVDVSVLPMRRPNARSVWRLRNCCGGLRLFMRMGAARPFSPSWVKVLVHLRCSYPARSSLCVYARWRYASAWVMECLFRLVFDAVLYVSPGEQAGGCTSSSRRPFARGGDRTTGRGADPTSRFCRAGCPASRVGLPRSVRDRLDRAIRLCQGLDLLLASIPAVAANLPNAVWVIIGDGDGDGCCRAYRRGLDAALADRSCS